MVFPTCVVNTSTQGSQTPCSDGDDVTAPPHTASWAYNQGLMRQASSSRGLSASYTYHWNLQLATSVYSNGVTGTYGQGTNGMVRPAQRSFATSDGTLFNTGAYAYDAAGNITQIGADRYSFSQVLSFVEDEQDIEASFLGAPLDLFLDISQHAHARG